MPEIRSGNPINDQEQKPVGSRSSFNLSHRFAHTTRFGEITPFLAMETVPTDVIKVRANHNLSTFTLKSPMLQNLSLKKDYFNVPMESILPLNWEKIYTNPVKGDDVPADAMCLLDLYNLGIYLQGSAQDLFSTMMPTGSSSAQDCADWLRQVISFLVMVEALFSKGSLMANMGYGLHGAARFQNFSTGEIYDVDRAVDQVLEYLSTYIAADTTSEMTLIFTFPEIDSNVKHVIGLGDPLYTYWKTSLRNVISLIRSGQPWNLSLEVSGTWSETSMFGPIALQLKKYLSVFQLIDVSAATRINVARPLAYQLVAAHFYTDDKIDFVYSAELFRENANYLVNKEAQTKPTFSYNGMNTDYDVFSEKYIMATILYYLAAGEFQDCCYYILTLFGYRNSLRFSDFFTGVKSQPVAVGDLNVDVNAGSPNYVSVLDVTRGIQMQRFLTAVNRAGARFSNYIKGLFGNAVAYDYHNPMYLGHTADVIYPSETQNTGADQLTQKQSITSVLGSNSGKFAFEFHADRPSVLIGVMYYDIERFYAFATDPQNLMKDRFDMFNPFLQYIGDQPISAQVLSMRQSEHTVGYSRITTFGYQQKDMAYKQSFSRCAGGFVDQLPSYIFQSDNDNPVLTPIHITPTYLRSHPSEFDPYYISLTGYALDSYFHFIVINELEIEASRPMAYNPSIL